MLRKLWRNYYRYIRVSKKESLFALFLGIIGAFLETFSIYLLANIITGLENNSLDLKIFTNESTSQFQNFYNVNF